jgi:hypothetical protein
MRCALILGVVVAALAGGGCTRVNPAYCDAETPCQNGGACDLTLNACGPAADAGLDGPPHGDAGDAGDAGGGDGGDAAVGCTGSTDCTDPDRPICVDAACQACGGDYQCLDRDSTRPACVSGQCLQCDTWAHCTTTGLPLCGADHACHACSRDVECQSGPQPTVGVCAAGDCPDADGVLWVDKASLSCPGTGSQAAPFCLLADAVTAAQIGAVKIILVKPGQHDLVLIKNNLLAGLLIVGQLGGDVVVLGDASHPAVDIDLVGAVTLRRLHLKGGGAAAGTTPVLQCASAACTGQELDVEAGGIGVKASAAAPLTLVRSRVHGNQAGGILVGNFSSYVIENNFIYSNGTPTSTIGGVAFISSFDTKRFVNNTVYANRVDNTAAAGVYCDLAGIVTTNNILWENRNDFGVAEVSTCTVTYSDVDDAAIAAIVGAHNTGSDPKFADVTLPPFNLHLTALSVGALGGADPTAAPADDIDGEPRPASGPTDIGADQRSQ